MVTRRLAKINRILREEISSILLMEVRDPRLEGVTITEVITSGDTRHARIYFTVIGGPDNIKEAVAGLQAASPYVRKLLSQRIRFRFTPELDFRYDENAVRATRIIETLEALREEEGFDEQPHSAREEE